MLNTRGGPRRMQRDMSLELMSSVRPAFEAGKAAGDRSLAREEFRWKKLSERQREEMKRQGDKIRARAEEAWEERKKGIEEEYRVRSDCLEGRVRELECEIEKLEEERGMLLSKVAEAGRDAAVARGNADVAEAALSGAMRRAEKAEGERAGLEERIEELHRRLLERDGRDNARQDQAAPPAVAGGGEAGLKEQWKADVERMEVQLQEEVARRVAAVDAAGEASRRADQAEAALKEAMSAAAAAREGGRKRQEAGDGGQNMALVRRLRDDLAASERERGEERGRHAAEMHNAGLAVQAERDKRAFAEQVAARMEQELVAQSRHLLKKMGMQQVTQ